MRAGAVPPVRWGVPDYNGREGRTTGDGLGTLVWVIVIGAAFALPGVLAYAGLWRSWSRARYPVRWFGLFWLGVALVCLGTAMLFTNGPFVPVFFVLMPAFVLCGALGFWMTFDGARWATPGWYRRAARR